MNQNLLIIGAGPLGQTAKETAESMLCFDKIDFLDDESTEAVGTLLEYEKFAVEYSFAFVAILEAGARMKWIQRLEEACYTIAVLVHRSAKVSGSAQIGRGTIVGSSAIIADNVVILSGCVIENECEIKAGSFLGEGSSIRAKVKVKENTVITDNWCI